jgi:hypothetical protein
MAMNEYKAVGETRIGSRNEVLGENSPPVPLCPPQIPFDLT